MAINNYKIEISSNQMLSFDKRANVEMRFIKTILFSQMNKFIFKPFLPRILSYYKR